MKNFVLLLLLLLLLLQHRLRLNIFLASIVAVFAMRPGEH
jgi:hypothetical protein